jgi:geranylgeranyl pyrophosphate synthase
VTHGSAIPPPVTQVLEAAQTWLPRLMGEVEARLAAAVSAHGEALAGDAQETLEAGGKRLRPMLVLLCGGREAGAEAIRAATAVELVHMATLVHDDVLDSAPIRRGRPTVLASSGRGRATAVGDLLLSRAFAELTADAADGRSEGPRGVPDAGPPADGAARRVALLAAASVALARGELAQRRDAFNLEIPAERYLERCRLKTAQLFECACVIGRDDPAADRELRAFGAEIGLAFQLLDDVLDVAGPAERTGKARGTDLLDGTVTLPLILARDLDPELAQLDLRKLDERSAAAVCDRIAATGALERVRDGAGNRVELAKRLLSKAPLAAEQRALMAMVADGVVERYS